MNTRHFIIASAIAGLFALGAGAPAFKNAGTALLTDPMGQ
jgi:hypothetical protein